MAGQRASHAACAAAAAAVLQAAAGVMNARQAQACSTKQKAVVGVTCAALFFAAEVKKIAWVCVGWDTGHTGHKAQKIDPRGALRFALHKK